MPRKPLDSEHETVTCTIRLTLRTRNALDEVRGEKSRSEYLRGLVERELEKPRLKVATAAQIEKRAKIKITPTEPHLHRYVKGEYVRHVKGVAQFRYRCECDETKVE